jgi:hypothetical protein
MRRSRDRHLPSLFCVTCGGRSRSLPLLEGRCCWCWFVICCYYYLGCSGVDVSATQQIFHVPSRSLEKSGRQISPLSRYCLDRHLLFFAFFTHIMCCPSRDQRHPLPTSPPSPTHLVCFILLALHITVLIINNLLSS